MSTALIVLGHGSRNPAAGVQFLELVARLRAARPEPVYAASMELAPPTLGEAVAEAVAAGATEIVVQPCFLFEGNHLRRDIPELLAGSRAQYPAVTFRCGGPIGPDQRLVEILLERAAGAPCLG
jgi:sirohydrochlorin cobaltochelatase